jgi:aminoglycoside phosphotransferase (APT) family kinase protein
MNLEECLPSELRAPSTTITKIAAGLSGAGVYRVEAAGQSFVLKVAGASETDADWQRALAVQRLAAEAGLAPRLQHVDQARRAVLTAFVADRSFPMFYRDPATHDAALALLGRTVSRLHAIAIPSDAASDASRRDPREFLAQVWGGLRADFLLPDFARQAIEGVLAERAPEGQRAPVLGHNDLNPSNLVYDGERILILDWATAGPMDPFYDLAVLAVFLRMEPGECARLLAAYDDTEIAALPDRFLYLRRLAARLAGTMQLYLARQMKHPGATAADTLAAALTLGAFYQRMLSGALKLGTPEGQWAFGLALLKESLAV